jgi:putative transposase
MTTVLELAPRFGVQPLCHALGVARATVYRRLSPPPTRALRQASPRALSAAENAAVLALLHRPEFVDQAPQAVFATLLDQKRYLCSTRTMYRILARKAEVRERRDQLTHPAYAKPELLADGPNQVWSWDITKLLGPKKWTYFYLYIILDIFSRYVTGWMVADRESATLATHLFDETCAKQRIQPGTLTVHADRGSSMRSKPVAFLLADLGVTKTHSRPHVSDDNPFSEAHFKTLKYRPSFPARFGSLEDARAHCAAFVEWYNNQHHHSGIALMTPAVVHHGLADDVQSDRRATLSAAYHAHPERFVHGRPEPPSLADHVWINPPKPAAAMSH